jgi:hypothetical protein
LEVKIKVKWQVRLAISFYTLKHKAAIRQLAIYRVNPRWLVQSTSVTISIITNVFIPKQDQAEACLSKTFMH